MVDAIQPCSSRAGMTTERSESGGADVVMGLTVPARSDVFPRARLFPRGFFSRASQPANAIPLLPVPYRAPSMEYRTSEDSDQRQRPAGQNGLRTMHSAAPGTCCLSRRRQDCRFDSGLM